MNKTTTALDRARDELFAHIHRCGVLKATAEQQQQWMDDTVDFLAEEHADLTSEQLQELRTIGLRFCQPVIPHGRGNDARTTSAEQATAA